MVIYTTAHAFPLALSEFPYVLGLCVNPLICEGLVMAHYFLARTGSPMEKCHFSCIAGTLVKVWKYAAGDGTHFNEHEARGRRV